MSTNPIGKKAFSINGIGRWNSFRHRFALVLDLLGNAVWGD